jgi:hypothetical protein
MVDLNVVQSVKSKCVILIFPGFGACIDWSSRTQSLPQG